MLSSGPGSSCDVCFELFDSERKAPTSIACGHIFCNSCIAQISDLCPMCRTPFDAHTCIRLHIDIDEPGCSSEDFKAAQKLQQKICSIVQDGISEQPLRQLIQEARTFLHGQPRNLHKDLKSLYRMLSYLCDVKAALRTKNSEVDSLSEEIGRLKDERASLQTRIADLEESRQYERETALAVETSLRDHCTQSIEVYKNTLQLYNKVAAENAELMLKLSNQLTSTSAKHTEARRSGSPSSSPPSIPSHFAPVVDAKILQRVGIQDPNSSYLISPLPQFTCLPSIAGSILPLPDLAEDEEDSNEDEDDEVSTPDSVHHSSHLREPKDHPRAAEAILLPLPQAPVGRMHPEPSGLSRTAPYREFYGRARSRSNPVQPTSRNQSRSQSPYNSTASSSPPLSPLQTDAFGAHSQVAHQTLSRGTVTASQTTAPQHALRSRLQDILSDSATSSSLPNMSSSYLIPSGPMRDSASARGGRVSPPRIEGSNSKTPMALSHSSSDNFSHLLASSSQSAGRPIPSVSPILPVQVYSGPPRISTASAEAKKLEDERRKRREERYKEGQTQDHDKYLADDDSWGPKAATSSFSASAVASAIPTSSASQAARRDQQPYPNSLNQNPTSTSSLKRGLSFSGSGAAYGKGSSSVPSAYESPLTHHARYPGSSMVTSGSKPSSKTNNVPTLPSSPPGIYT